MSIAWLIVGFVLGSATPAVAADFQGIDRDRLRHVIDACYNLDGAAPELIAQLQRDYPDSLAPEFIRVDREYWLQSYAEVDREGTAAFERDSAALVEDTSRELRLHPGDVDTRCVSGLSQLLVGFYNVEKRHWWAAFWKVRSGRNAMLNILEEHPDYADAKMPVGLADCYLDRTPGYLKPLTLLLGATGDLQRGLQRLRDAREGGLFTQVDAMYYLAGVQKELCGDPAAARTEMAKLTERFPENPFYQRLLGYFEMHAGMREQGRQRLTRIPDMKAAREIPALAVRSLMWLCWDCMAEKNYDEALRASERAGALIDQHPQLADLRPETLVGQGESLKALKRYEESFARFEAVSTDNLQWRQHALDRVSAIKAEIGWKK